MCAWFGSATPPPATMPDGKTKYQGPTTPTLAPLPLLPPSTTLAASTATAAAQAAARKQKQQAMAGATLLTAPAIGVQPVVIPPATLLGR